MTGEEVIKKTRLVVAIDGPSGAGKSTLAKNLAAACGARYLNTGSMYRAVALRALRAGVDLADGKALAEVAARAGVRVSFDPAAEGVWVDDQEVSAELRTVEVTQVASRNVAAVPEVRALLVAEQRRVIASLPRIVVEGRDIGTVVAPDADVKVFLTASAGARAERRVLQNQELRVRGDHSDVLEQLERRDAFDASREASPFQQAPDAIVFDTSDLSAQEAVERLLSVLRERELL